MSNTDHLVDLYLIFKYLKMAGTSIASLMVFLVLAVHIQSFLVQKHERQDIEVELGTAYHQNLSTPFRNFQFSKLTSFKRQDNNKISSGCRVQVSNQGELTQLSSLPYNQSHSRQWMDDKIVYSFQELKQLKTLNDLIYFNKALYAFFTNNQLSIYSLHSENGTLSQKYSFTIDHPTMIDDGHFVEVQGHLLIVSSKLAVRVLEEGSYDRVSTYNGTVNDISDFKVINSTVYLGLSSKGIEVYNYIASNNSLVFTKKATFGFKSRFEEASFSVDELDIDPSTRSLYILDYIEGLLEVPLPHLTQFTEIYSPNARLLVSRCENLVVMSLSIYVTCPELIQIERASGKVLRMWHNDFSPSTMEFKNQRLYLFGRQDFAVYDMFGKVIDSYSLTVESELSLIIEDYLVTFSKLGVISQSVSVQQQELYCFAKEQSAAGEYVGLIQTEGLCEEYNGSANGQRGTDVCTIEYPIHVVIKDSSKLDLTLELYGLAGWLGFCAIFGTVMAIYHTIKMKKYRTLNEEEVEMVDPQHFKLQQQTGSKVDLGHGSKPKQEEIEVEG